ncbi:MAG: GNAT family N-acetyltransferase [Candidatus Aenigmarchaeota archaeon]|nr:GNAT family N-acetyltransferase [Candidatus Aenigmarchaeota archaeon]
MQCEIMEYRKDPAVFGKQIVGIIARCYSKMAEEIKLDPSLSLGHPEILPERPLAGEMRKASEHAARHWQERVERWKKEMQFGSKKHLVALGQDGKAVGSGAIDIAGKGLLGRGPELFNLYVEPSEQRLGIGSLLLRDLENFAYDKLAEAGGEWKVNALSHIYRPTLDFYSKNGYRVFLDEKTLFGQDGFLLPSAPVRKSLKNYR